MKKIIQVCSLLTLVFIMSAASISAQSSFGTEVEIPFAFNVDDHAYEAGSYIVKVQRYASGNATLSIENTKTDEIQTVVLNVNGDGPAKDVRLVFDTIEGRRYLTKVRTNDRTYALLKPKPSKNAGGALN